MLTALDLLMVRDLHWLQDYADGLRFAVNFALSGVVLWVMLSAVKGLADRQPWLARSLLALLALGYYAQAAHFAVFRKFIGAFELRFFWQEPLVSLQLYAQNGLTVGPFVAAAGAVAVWAAVMRASATTAAAVAPAPTRWNTGLVLLALPIFALLTFNWYGAANFQHAPVALAGHLLRAVEPPLGSNSPTPADKPVIPAQAPAADAPDIVLVIGESLNRFHMQLYGYERPTTPELVALQGQGALLAFENVVSIGPRTLVSVPYLLTGLQGIDPAGIIYRTPTLFNYAKASGYETALITAQDFQWRNIDKLFVDRDLDHFRQGSDFSADVDVSVGADDQRVLDRGVFPWLQARAQMKRPLLLVTQMSGSHPPYASQVPQALKPFLPEDHPEGINAYDNTVWYTDLYLKRLVETVRRHRPNSWVFFSSDHGQHVTGQGGLFHGDLSDEVLRVPLIVFPPPGQHSRVRAGLNAPVSQADIMATILELMQRQAVTELDGLSLLQPIPGQRLRVATAYMKTLNNDPMAALVFPDGRRYELNFQRKSVTLEDGKTVMPLDRLPPAYWAPFERRLKIP